MFRILTPNKAIVGIILSPVVFIIIAEFLTTNQIRNIFTPIAFGVSLMIWVTWLASFFSATQTRAWKLIFGIFATYLTIFARSAYVYAYNAAGRPDSWDLNPISAYWSYGFTIAGLAILAATIEGEDPAPVGKYWVIIAAVAIGAFVAGATFAIGVEWLP